MLDSANSSYSLEIEKLRHAYIYVANCLYSKNYLADKKPRLSKIQNQTTLCLLQIMIAQIFKSKNVNSLKFPVIANNISANSNVLSAITHEFQSIDSDEFFNNNPEFLMLTTENVEDIGTIYDLLQNFKLKIKDAKLVIVNCSKQKKKLGSFYTPIHIVDFIVEKTLGRYIDKLSNSSSSTEDFFKALLKLKILDPSVGGGIFLIRAVRFLELWILKKYPKLENRSRNNIIDKFIANCLFGYDVNKTACYLTKMSLFLLMHKPNADDLFFNVTCANSLDLINAGKDTNKYDIVISNPPFQFGENIPKLKKNTSAKYKLASGQFDIFWLFYELALKKILKDGGYHGYIIPDSIMTRDESKNMRNMLLDIKITDIWHIGTAFTSLHVSTIILVWQNRKPAKSNRIDIIDTASKNWRLEQQSFKKDRNLRFLIYLATEELSSIISKMNKTQLLIKDLFLLFRGEEFGKKALLSKGKSENKILCGDNILPFRILEPSLYIRNCGMVRKPHLFSNNQVLIRKTGSDLIAAFDTNKSKFLQSVYGLKLLENHSRSKELAIYKTLLGLLNSRLINFYVHYTFTAYKLVYPQFNQSTIAEIPLPAKFLTTDWTDLINLVEKLMKNAVQNPESLHAGIDAIVYSAYNLSDNEIKLVNKHQTRLSFKR